MELVKPYNLLMPYRGHSLTVEVLAHTRGELMANLQQGQPPTPLTAIRLHTTRLDKASKMVHVDITSTQVHAMLDGFLRLGTIHGKAVEFRSRGIGAMRRDSLHLKPKGT